MSDLNFLQQSDLLHSKDLTPETARKYAEQFLQAGRHVDALNFFEKVNDVAGLDKLVEIAKEEGDSFLLLRVFKAKKEPPSADLLRAVGDKAFELGKYYDAKTAYQHLGDSILLDKVKPFLVTEEEIHLPTGAKTEI